LGYVGSRSQFVSAVLPTQFDKYGSTTLVHKNFFINGQDPFKSDK